MSGDRLAMTLFIMTALILPLSALIARRMDWSRLIQLVLVWASIFILGVAVVRLTGIVE